MFCRLWQIWILFNNMISSLCIYMNGTVTAATISGMGGHSKLLQSAAPPGGGSMKHWGWCLINVKINMLLIYYYSSVHIHKDRELIILLYVYSFICLFVSCHTTLKHAINIAMHKTILLGHFWPTRHVNVKYIMQCYNIKT